ncbi:MAG: family 43 glycosylhydrolase [Planctomycetia bacterium]|nr:family 43 glycosylhydrolase [Planctomycetia bacterium]
MFFNLRNVSVFLGIAVAIGAEILCAAENGVATGVKTGVKNVLETGVKTVFSTPEGMKSITPADFISVAEPEMMFPNSSTTGLEQWIPNRAKDPSVVWFRDQYLLYFSIFPTKETPVECCLGIGIAASQDLKNWNLVGIVTPLTEVDQKGCGAPCAKVWDDKVHLFYQSYGNGAADTILYAVSDDGIHFTPHADNPIFSPSGDWTNGRAIDADFFEFNGKCFLYVATRDKSGKIQKIAVATAENRDEIGRGKWTQTMDESILEPALPWETKCIEAPTLLEHNGKAYMFYAGGYNNDPQHVGVAVSDDGLHFTRLWDVPFIKNGPDGQWNHSETGHPGIFRDHDGQVYLFFQGNATHGKDWYLSWVKIGWKGENNDIPYVME